MHDTIPNGEVRTSAPRPPVTEVRILCNLSFLHSPQSRRSKTDARAGRWRLGISLLIPICFSFLLNALAAILGTFSML